MAMVVFSLDVNLVQMDDGSVSWVIQYLNYGRETGREGYLEELHDPSEVEGSADALIDALLATNCSMPLPTIRLRRPAIQSEQRLPLSFSLAWEADAAE